MSTTPTTAPVSTIWGNPSNSLFQRISRATNNTEFNEAVNGIAELTGFILVGEEEILSGSVPVTGSLEGTVLQRITAIKLELEQVILQSNVNGTSGIPVQGRTPPDTRTINPLTGIITLGRPVVEGERFNPINGALYRRIVTTPPPPPLTGGE